MNNVSVTRLYRKRHRHAPEFKARLVAECHNPGASVSRIALNNDLNKAVENPKKSPLSHALRSHFFSWLILPAWINFGQVALYSHPPL
jgi:hypothetical protein